MCQNETAKAAPKPSILQNLSQLIPPEFQTHQGHAAIYMTLAMTILFFGYEFTRAGILSLFTSSTTGFPTSTPYSMAIACVSPFSVLMVIWYGHQLEICGPRVALRHTTLGSALVIFGSAALVQILQYTSQQQPNHVHLCKGVIFLSFIFQNSYVQLLCTQHWSFLGSILTKSQGMAYFASIAGLSSISSTFAGTLIPIVVKGFKQTTTDGSSDSDGTVMGLIGLLFISSVSLVLTAVFADRAYSISQKHGFDPSEEFKNKKKNRLSTSNSDNKTNMESTQSSSNSKDKDESKGSSSSSVGGMDKSKNQKEDSMVTKAIDLFGRVPLLAVLFLEVICFQTMVAILNLMFMTKVKAEIPVDADRAVWTGKFYSIVNGSSAILQFLVLPILMKKVKPESLWKIMPLIPMACTFDQCLQNNDPSLTLISFSLFSTKCIDYALRNIVSELVFVSLDFESRYFGKEIIGVFGNKLGKSTISLILSILPFVFGSHTDKTIRLLAWCSSLSWSFCTFRLSHLVSSSSTEQTKSTPTSATDKEKIKAT